MVVRAIKKQGSKEVWGMFGKKKYLVLNRSEKY